MTAPHPISDAALASHLAVLGKTGSGKTSTAKLAIEQVVVQGARVCVLDPIKSDWWGLTSSADGHRAGLPFQILGGPHGHVPLTSSAGAAVAALVASGDLPLSIIDMAQFEAGGLQAFFNAFAPALLQHMRGVLYLVIEEAHLFAPKERSGIGAETHAIHWAKTLATAGRSKGIRLILATQRTQALHNAMLGSCETMIAHRLTAPADQEPVKKWLKANVSREIYTEVESSLAGLHTGTAWLCSGEAGIFEKIGFPRIATFDNTATPTGELVDRKVKQAPIDVGKLRALIGEKVAEAEANDLAKLKARIAELEAASKAGASARHAGEASAAPEIQAKAAEAERRGYDKGYADGCRHGKAEGVAMANLAIAAIRLNDEVVETPSGSPRPNQALKPEAGTARVKQTPSRTLNSAGASSLTGPQRQFLKALAWWNAMGHHSPSRAQLAAIAGWKITSGHLKNVAGSLSSAGMISYPQPGTFALTPKGAITAPAPDTSATLIESLKNALNGPQRIALEALLGSRGKLSRSDLAKKCGWEPTSGHVKNVVGSLSTLEIVEYPEPGTVALQSWVRS